MKNCPSAWIGSYLGALKFPSRFQILLKATRARAADLDVYQRQDGLESIIA